MSTHPYSLRSFLDSAGFQHLHIDDLVVTNMRMDYDAPRAETRVLIEFVVTDELAHKSQAVPPVTFGPNTAHIEVVDEIAEPRHGPSLSEAMQP